MPGSTRGTGPRRTVTNARNSLVAPLQLAPPLTDRSVAASRQGLCGGSRICRATDPILRSNRADDSRARLWNRPTRASARCDGIRRPRHRAQRGDGCVCQCWYAPFAGRFTCEVGDVCSANLGRSFDAVISLFHVVSYQASDEALQAVFEVATAHLGPSGVFLFDVWHGPTQYRQGSLRVRVRRPALRGDHSIR